MKARALILLLGVSLWSCVRNPGVTVTRLDGTTISLSTGYNLMAEVDEQVSEVRGGGFVLKHMVKRQDATRVPIAGLNTAGLMAGGWFQSNVSKAKEVTTQISNTNAAGVAKNASNNAAAEAAAASAAKGTAYGQALDHGAVPTVGTVTPP